MASFSIRSHSEEPPPATVATPVLWAQPVNQGKGLGKLLGKTMEAVSHPGGLFPKVSKKSEGADQGAPADAPFRLFDPHRNETPIRTARLFKIQINPPVAEPVAGSSN